MKHKTHLTIGQLGKLTQLPPSTLRYYEKEGLLQPDGRSDSGYRLYQPQTAERLHLIQRAQRLGFSLADIRTLLAGWDEGTIGSDTLSQLAENRFIALEKQLTELLVLRHELDLFLQDVQSRQSPLHQEQISDLPGPPDRLAGTAGPMADRDDQTALSGLWPILVSARTGLACARDQWSCANRVA